MVREDYFILLVETILGTAAFYGLLTADDWGIAERIFMGSAFILVVFAIEQRGIWADEQYRQIFQILNLGFSSRKEEPSFSDELTVLLKRAEFERRTGLHSFQILTLFGRYVLWLILSFILYVFQNH
ncbi:MAG: hypothetical protein KKA54_15730 [Proteobacteria bacterium]|nr:hypothetical protein [Pseudomonadota bacterium]